MLKYYLIIICVLTVINAQAQNPLHITIKNTTLAATDSVLPFWFVANQHGKVQAANPFSNITDLTIGQSHSKKKISGFSYSWGGNVIAAFGETNYYQINQAFAGLSLKGWEIKGGMFHYNMGYSRWF